MSPHRPTGFRTADFHFDLPEELIAQHPAPCRDQSRLLILDRRTGRLEHHGFAALADFLRPGDVLVLNNTRVIPARLRACNARSGGESELLLLPDDPPGHEIWAMVRPGRRARAGTVLILRDRAGQATGIRATVVGHNAEGHRLLRFDGVANVLDALAVLGETPLPPYIKRIAPNLDADDERRYQTVYAETPGSVAAPTAGLHFTRELLDDLRARGVIVCCLTLHVGLGTFAPVKAEYIRSHTMHEERFLIPAATAEAVRLAKKQQRRVVAVGTTTVRALESGALRNQGVVVAGPGRTDIFIHPPFDFRMVDALLTNFHLPGSTLLMLVSAFAAPAGVRGREAMLAAYAEAVRQRYRFFSYGDAMLIL